MKITERYSKKPLQKALYIKEARYIGDFAIRLTFSDGHRNLVDFKPFLESTRHPAIQKYFEESLFKNFQIQQGNLDWNDFDLCFPLEDLYKNSLSKEIEKPHKII
ncbi:MAG: DUF2442 domain-containing protein [Bacteroidia bacterium]|nr:DUF2442 domain-containing protein [Bacteroidia bacterium]